MRYRPFGETGWEVSVLGFGAMRLPLKGDTPKEIDIPRARSMVRQAIDAGVNYIDTAYVYHGGESEPFLGAALKNGYRDRVKLATKLPPWNIQASTDFDRILDEQRRYLDTDVIDCYLLHGLGHKHWPMLRDFGVLDWAERMKAQGKIGHLGFSFHDHFDLFREIIDAYDKWEFCQIQFNYMDTEFQAGKAGLKLAAEKGLGVVVMEPLRGGQLVNNLPESVMAIWSSYPEQRSPAEWALRWVWDHAEVSTVLSGMSSMEELVENLKSADQAQAGVMSESELALIDEVCSEYRKTTPIDCTACNYCMPCQADIDIPEIFQRYNDAFRYDDLAKAKRMYNTFMANRQVDRCEECFECEEICPQELSIVEWLQTCHRAFKA